MPGFCITERFRMVRGMYRDRRKMAPERRTEPMGQGCDRFRLL